MRVQTDRQHFKERSPVCEVTKLLRVFSLRGCTQLETIPLASNLTSKLQMGFEEEWT